MYTVIPVVLTLLMAPYHPCFLLIEYKINKYKKEKEKRGKKERKCGMTRKKKRAGATFNEEVVLTSVMQITSAMVT